MKIKNILFCTLLAAFSFLAGSCIPDEPMPADLDLSESVLNFEADGGTLSFTVNSDASWTASLVSAADWVTINPTSGNGPSTVTVTVGEMGDDDRSALIKIQTSDPNVWAGVKINQLDEDPTHIYKLVDNATPGKSYLIVADGLAFKPYPSGTGYGYNYGETVAESAEGEITRPDGSLGWLFEEREGGFAIKGSDGRYIYDAGYNSFNVGANPTGGDVWTCEPNGDGTVKIINVETKKFIQLSTSYSSYGCYPGEQDGGVYPVLYEDSKAPDSKFLTAAPEELTVLAKESTAEFTVSSNLKWKVTCDASWIKSFTQSGQNDGTIVVTFDPNEDTENSRTAVFTVSCRKRTAVFTLTQKAAVPGTVEIPYEESFSADQGAFEIVDVEKDGLDHVWAWGGANYGMKASAYVSNVNHPTESWIVSPSIDLTGVSSAVLTFDHTYRYVNDPEDKLTVWASVDGENWSQLYVPQYPTGTNWTFVNSGEISLKAYAGGYVKIGFKYVSTSSAAATWEVKNFKVDEGEAQITSIAGVKALATSSSEVEFTANWTDAVVTFVNGNNAFIEDANSGIQLYMKNSGLAAGQKINGTVSGKVKLYNKYAELTSLDCSAATITEGAEIPVASLTIADLVTYYKKYENRRVKIAGVTVTDAVASGDRNGKIAQGDDVFAVYDQIKTIVLEEGAQGDIIGYPTRYNDNLQLGLWAQEDFITGGGDEPAPEPEIKDVSLAEFLAAETGDTWYRISGLVTSIVKDTYGNIYIADATDTVYVYGVLPEKGSSDNQNFTQLGVEVGDVITVIGQRGEYKGSPQAAGSYYEKHIDIKDVTVAEFLAAAEDKNVFYRLSGTIVEATEDYTKNDLEVYGNFNIQDETGSVYVYGVTTGYKGESKKFATFGLGLGDKITIHGYRTSYNGLNQVGGAYFISGEKAE